MTLPARSPRISVVMGAFNAAPSLARSLDSILTQEGVDLEVIVVDDGSTDGTGALLDDFARRDTRVRAIHQENQGLTCALIRGCAAARGEFIARQDADDISLPGRLAAQLERMSASDRPVMVAVGCGCCSEEGDLLYETMPPTDPAEARRVILEEGRGICFHGALLFRRDVYLAAGGYRVPFYYAQDIDLILRLAARGVVAGIPKQLYDFQYSPLGISGRNGPFQVGFYNLARACQRCRETGASEQPSLDLAAAVKRGCRTAAKGPDRSLRDGYVFIGSCLRARDPERARQYFLRAWRLRPLDLRLALRYLSTFPSSTRTGKGAPVR